MERRDYYAILNVRQGASETEIRASYRRLVRECHPDLHPEDELAGERLKQINEAYEALTKREEETGSGVVERRGRSVPVSYSVRWQQSPRAARGPLWEPFFYGYRLSNLEYMLEVMEQLDAALELEWLRMRRLFDLL